MAVQRTHTLFSGDDQEIVTNANLLRMAHAGIAFCTMALSANSSAVVALISLIWFGTALADLRKNLKKKR